MSRECAPERSVARILAERNGSAYPANAPALPIGVKPVESIEPPEDSARRRIFDAVGSATYRAWFQEANVWPEGDLVRVSLGSRWRFDCVERNYASVLARRGIRLTFGELATTSEPVDSYRVAIR